MIHWIVLGVWVLGFLLTWRYIVWTVAMLDVGNPDGEDVLFGIFFGTLVAAVWPAFFSIRAAIAIWNGHTDTVIAAITPRHVRRERDLAAREERIVALEEELGIDRQ